MVWAHGGPTDHVPPVLDLQIAYFTSRGIGVVEVNYGGSTGYGRAYRERLREQWGVVDVEDCAAVARALAAEGTADPARLAIRGGSAGGWTAAASLAATDVYACGTISYPVLDLIAFAEETHDLESRYIDSLAGPPQTLAVRGRERSPVARADRITAPFVLLQGAGGPDLPARPGGAAARGAARPPGPARVPRLRGRGPRLPARGDHGPGAGGGTLAVRAGVRDRAARRAEARAVPGASTARPAPLGPVFRIMPGSRGLARTLAALSSVANAPRWLPPPPCDRTHQTPLPDPA
ncbi:hypothetical protein GCM10020254_20870 [Streptomyces goshikiensis]